jgi:hypothetical protein
MARLLSPDDACVEVDVPFGRSARYSGRTIDVTDPTHVWALRQAGYTVAGTASAARSGGYHCDECGFKGFFTTCGRCGASCDRAA